MIRGTGSRGAAVSVIFISYRRGDSADKAGRISERLAREFGKEAVFFDRGGIGAVKSGLTL